MNQHDILSPDAEADIDAAIRWYENIDPSLAFRFTSDMLKTLERIEQFPRQFPRMNAVVRQALLKKFPYAIYFSLNINVASVIAVLHQRRARHLRIDRDNGHRFKQRPP